MTSKHAPTPPYDPCGAAPDRLAVWGASVHQLLRRAREHWYLYLPVLAIWGLAFVRMAVDPTPHLPVLFNWSDSLPYHVALVRDTAVQPLQRGDYIVYRFDGPGALTHPGLRGQPFFKQVRGVPGDRITTVDRAVLVNDQFMGFAKTRTRDHLPLSPITSTVIPSGHYYVQGSSPDSFDSRYAESGLVRADQVLAIVDPLF